MSNAPEFVEFTTTEIGAGLRLHHARIDRIKTVVVKALLRFDLAPVDATRLALLRSLLRHGTVAHPSLRAVTRHLETLYGTSFGAEVHKVGESQVLGLHAETVADRFLTAMGGEAGTLKSCLAFVRDILTAPALDDAGAFPADRVAQEKANLKRYIEGLVDDKEAYAVEQCIRTMCAGEPFAIYEQGDVADLDGLDGADLATFLARSARRAPIDVYVTGHVERDRAVELARATIGTIPREPGDSLRGTTPHPPPRGEVSRLVEHAGIKQAKLVLAWRSAIRHGDDAFYELLVANGILGAFTHSKLFRNVREAENLCYYASSHLERTKGLLLVASGVEPESTDRATELILAQVDAIVAGDISEDELSATKTMLTDGIRGVQDSPGRLAHLHYIRSHNGRTEGHGEAIERIMAVDRDGIIAAAKGLTLDTTFLLAPSPPTDAPDQQQQQQQQQERA